MYLDFRFLIPVSQGLSNYYYQFMYVLSKKAETEFPHSGDK